MGFTSLHFHFTSLHITSLHFTSLHFTFTSLHFTSLHFTSLHFTSLHFTSLHFTSLYFTLLHFHFTCKATSASHQASLQSASYMSSYYSDYAFASSSTPPYHEWRHCQDNAQKPQHQVPKVELMHLEDHVRLELYNVVGLYHHHYHCLYLHLL